LATCLSRKVKKSPLILLRAGGIHISRPLNSEVHGASQKRQKKNLPLQGRGESWKVYVLADHALS